MLGTQLSRAEKPLTGRDIEGATDRAISARAPTRIDLGGGWTDVPPYCDREGGFVCNVAIARYASVRVDDASGGRANEKAADGAGTNDLLRAALKRSGVRPADVRINVSND